MLLLLVLPIFWFGGVTTESSHDVLYLETVYVPLPSIHRGEYCHENTCKEPATLPITQFEVVEASSPLYMSVLPLNNKTELIDNVCYSFFETGGTTLLFYISVVFKDGSSEQWSYSKDDVPGRLGVLRGGNPTCLFQEDAILFACQTTIILYRCFLFGTCTQFDAFITPGVDVLIAASAEPKISEECKEEHVAVMSSAGFNDRGYVKLPQSLPYQCVTSLHGAPSVGAEKVPPEDSISKP